MIWAQKFCGSFKVYLDFQGVSIVLSLSAVEIDHVNWSRDQVGLGNI